MVFAESQLIYQRDDDLLLFGGGSRSLDIAPLVLTLVTISITLPFMTLIAVTWAVWEGRFGWWFLVLWTVWAGIGTSHLIQLVKQRLPCQRRQIARRLMPQSSI